MTVNWNNIRTHNGTQQLGFEELCCQLFHNELPPNATFERRGYRDAGLECAYVHADGKLSGIQAKFFIGSPSEGEWAQVTSSFKTAIDKNPTLTHLTLCIPQNLDDPKIPNASSAMDQWKRNKAKWEEYAREKHMAVEFELWDDTQLTSRLTQSDNRGKLLYFFDKDLFTLDWFQDRIEEVADNANPRYTEELNVDLPIAKLFDGLGRTEAFAHELFKLYRKLRRNFNSHALRSAPAEHPNLFDDTNSISDNIAKLLTGFDATSTVPLPLDEIAQLCDKLGEEALVVSGELSNLDDADAKKKHKESEKSAKHDAAHHTPPYTNTRYVLTDISNSAYRLAEFVKSNQAKLANKPALLISGSAGKGKTHLLVDVAKQRISKGLPTIVLLGAWPESNSKLSRFKFLPHI